MPSYIFILEHEISDDKLIQLMSKVFHVEYKHVYVEDYDNVPWKQVMEKSPHLVCERKVMQNGNFQMIILVTFIQSYTLSKTYFKYAVQLQELETVGHILLPYEDGIPSHYVLIKGQDEAQHIYIDPVKNFELDTLEYEIIGYGELATKDELNKLIGY